MTRTRSRILLVDDQVLFVESLRTVLEAQADDLEVVGIAHTGEEAVALVESTAPDLVLMDVRMPSMDGVRATAVILKQHPSAKVVMLTTFDDDEYVHQALEEGAVGYLLKNIQAEELVKSVRAALAGSVLISPSIAKKLFQPAQNLIAPADLAARLPPWIAQLTLRERDVLRFLGRGWSNRVIAQRLYVAEQTVKNHVSVIYEKLCVENRTALMELIERDGVDLEKIV